MKPSWRKTNFTKQRPIDGEQSAISRANSGWSWLGIELIPAKDQKMPEWDKERDKEPITAFAQGNT